MASHILVVDDERDAFELFRRRFRGELKRGEYEIEFAISGSEALDKLEEQGSDKTLLVVSDIAMPGMTGLELLQEIKGRWPLLRVLIMTAFGDEETRQRAISLGADDLFSKPVDFGMFKDTVRRLAMPGETV